MGDIHRPPDERGGAIDSFVKPYIISQGSALPFLLVLLGVLPRAPQALIALTLAALGVFAVGAAASGVDLVGAVPSGWPSLHLPGLGYAAGQAIGMEAVGLVIVSFTSGMLTARSFAARNGYGIDPNQELRAFGPAFKCITLSRSFGSALMLSWSGPHTQRCAKR